MSKNETALQWLEKHHPEIYAMYLDYLKDKKRARGRAYQKKIHELAKQNEQKD